MPAWLTARVVRGLEWVAADEIAELGAQELVVGTRQVAFEVGDGARALGLRTVDDVFARVGAVDGVGRSASTLAATARSVGALDLAGAVRIVAALRPLPARPAVDVVVSLDGDRRFNRYDLEDALGPLVASALGGSHGSRRHGRPPPADLCIRVAVTGEQADVAVRLAERPLHRRPWKVSTGPGTLHPPVAAALVRLAGPNRPLVDPCCGDGTIVVEWGRSGSVVGLDLDPTRLAHAADNAAAAGLHPALGIADAGALPIITPVAVGAMGPRAAIVTNPPWDIGVAAGGRLQGTLGPLWAEAGRVLGADGVLVSVVGEGFGAPDELLRSGWDVAVAERVRLAGRLGDVVVATPGPGADPLSPSLRAWRATAAAAGLDGIDRAG